MIENLIQAAPERTIPAGFRYRLHVSNLPGKPDLVFPKYKAAILVHGCFWHCHPDCWWCSTPSSNSEFWAAKFDQNTRRDAKNVADLEDLGWRVAIVWECALRLQGDDDVALAIGRWLTEPQNAHSAERQGNEAISERCTGGSQVGVPKTQNRLSGCLAPDPSHELKACKNRDSRDACVPPLAQFSLAAT